MTVANFELEAAGSGSQPGSEASSCSSLPSAVTFKFRSVSVCWPGFKFQGPKVRRRGCRRGRQ